MLEAQRLSNEPPRKVRRGASAGLSDFSSTVTINVGIKPDRKVFVLHRHVIHNSSCYLATAMKTLDDDKPISLPNVTVKDFAVYANFLYTGLLCTKETDIAELAWCLHLYKIAKDLKAIDFQDATIDALIEIILEHRASKGQCRFTANQITTIYAMTEEGSPLRKFAQNLCLQSKGPNGFEKKRLEGFPVEFQLDLLTAAAPFITSSAKSIDMQDPLDLGRSCKYHNHTVLDMACYKSRYPSMSDEPALATSVAARSSSPFANI